MMAVDMVATALMVMGTTAMMVVQGCIASI